MTVGELGARMSIAEFFEWVAFFDWERQERDRRQREEVQRMEAGDLARRAATRMI